jgi:MFS family permease
LQLTGKSFLPFIVFTILASLDNAAAGVLPPLYAIIAGQFSAGDEALGFVSALYLLVAAVSALYWGYRGDRGGRKKLLFWGTIFWVSMMLLTATASEFQQFLLFQLGTAAGVGSVSAVSYSMVSDLVPAHRRGLALSLWSISQVLGAGLGALLASTLGALDWRYPFWIVAGFGLLFAGFFVFVKEPARGQMEPALIKVIAEGRRYRYRIHWSAFPRIIQQRSTALLLAQRFFYALSLGSTLWVPRWALARVEAEGYDLTMATIVGNLFVLIFSLGSFFAIYAGHWGDQLQNRRRNGRPILAASGLLLSIPLFILMFFLPLRGVILPTEGNLFAIAWAVLSSLFTNGWVMLMFVVAFIGLALQAVEAPNWAAMITDLNLPEHRGTVIGMSRIFTATGNAISVGLAGWLISSLSANFPSPWNYSLGLTAFQFLTIPAGVFYLLLLRYYPRDWTAVQQTLALRAQEISELAIGAKDT